MSATFLSLLSILGLSLEGFHELSCQLQNICQVPALFNEMQGDNHKIYTLFHFTEIGKVLNVNHSWGKPGSLCDNLNDQVGSILFTTSRALSCWATRVSEQILKD